MKKDIGSENGAVRAIHDRYKKRFTQKVCKLYEQSDVVASMTDCITDMLHVLHDEYPEEDINSIIEDATAHFNAEVRDRSNY